ncbi:splicing factor, Prp19-binding domain-containing protein [Tricharina praecox]|uniref:splicing factor, Prp19-binding domain-containing protein n=1 Tax=Tricharina praecox TaxID=43433 RepID=UPI002220D372|nr:splicing factor, Prp19-binding domain-containing protein [Tricharina praecox]KAI5859072.1 splicing factor, Prp19-binding domain-containing protein [Tricharina praecox]
MPPKRMTANPVRPARYRPGKPLAAAASESESSDESGSEEDSGGESDSPPPAAALPKPVFKKKVAAAPALKDVDLDKRFDEGKKKEEMRLKREEDERKRKELEGSADEYTTEESSDEEESDEEEEEAAAEEEAEEAPRKVFQRPTFVPKSQRGERVERVVKAEDEEEKARQRLEAEELLELHLKRDAAAKAAGRKGWDDDEDPDGLALDDTDGTDPFTERAAWKLRELTRIKREREAFAAIEAERAEIERRREMDPALRDKEDREFVRDQRKEKMESQGKMGFMQKFYHKGAFFQDADVPKRNYATAEVEDRVKNREVLPKYLQVRGDEVGKRGRTRWTHLAAEDTSMQAGGSPWFDKKGGFPGGGERGGGFAGGTGVNSVPVAAGVDERFRADSNGGRAPDGRERGERSGRDRDERTGERTSRWDDRERDHKPRDHGDRDRDRDRDQKPRSRWDDDGGRGNSRPERRGGGGGGDSYIPGGRDGDCDRDRKRPHSPPRGGDKEKRRRRDASPV